MAGFTLMVMVWVGIVRAAKGKVMTSKVSGLCSGSVRGISVLITLTRCIPCVCVYFDCGVMHVIR